MSKDLIQFDSNEFSALRLQVKNEFIADRKASDGLSLSLDKDPSAKSPAVLFTKMYEAREHTNKLAILYSRYMKIYLMASKAVFAFEEDKRVHLNKIFAEKAESIKALRSTDEKLRYCEDFLDADLKQRLSDSKIFLEEAKGYHLYFKHRFEIIKDTKGDILTQLGLLKVMIMMGEIKVLNSQNLDQVSEVSSEDTMSALNDTFENEGSVEI